MADFSAQSKTPPRKKPKLFYGWWIVISSAAINLYLGGTYFYGFSAFFKPIQDTFHWNRATLSLPLALRSVETGLFSPVLGFLADRLGPRKIMVAGALLAGLGAIWLGRTSSLATFYAAILMLALGASACSGYVVPMAAVANWFNKKMGKATALVMFGFGLGGVLVPVVEWMTDKYGWQTSLLIIGIGIMVICLPLTLFARHKPEQYGYLPDGEPLHQAGNQSVEAADANELPTVEYKPKEALKTRTFWLLTVTTMLGQLGIGAILVHVIPYVEEAAFHGEKGRAGFVVTAMLLLSLIGRFGFGWLADIYEKRKLLAISLALQATGMFIFAYVTSVWLLIPFLLTFGTSYAGQAALRVTIQREYFGRSSFASIQGLLTIGSTVAQLVAPYIAGRIFDAEGSYRIAWLAFASSAALAVPLALMLKPARQHVPEKQRP